MGKVIKEEDLQLNIIVNGNDTRKKIGELSRSVQDLKSANEKLEEQRRKLKAAGQKESQQYKELTAQIKANKAQIKEYNSTISSLTANMKVSDMTMGELLRRAKELNAQFHHAAPGTKQYAQLSKQLREVNTRMEELKAQTKGVGGAMDKLGLGKLQAFIGKMFIYYQAIRGIFRIFSSGIKTIKDFEQANVNLSTILGVSISQMTALTQSALELGRTTEYTASQVTNLQTELAKLGFGQQQILQMQKPILQFATAVGAELPEAAALAGATLRAFDQDASQTDDVLATMAVGCNKSALSFAYLQESMSIVAPVAKTFGFGIKDVVTLLGTLANSGFDASSAATATRNILLNLADANGKLAKELGKPVHTLPDLIDGLQQLDAKGINLSKTLELTDKRSVAAFNTFLRGAGTMGELKEAVTDVDGELKRISEERLQTVEGQTKILKSAWEGLVLSFYNSKGAMKSVIQWLTRVVEGVTSLIGESGSLVDQFDQQLDRVTGLERNIRPLVTEYETLRTKTSLNADEHERLQTITKQLSDAYPGAIAAVDQYGNAIEINTEKVNKFIDAERARLKYMHADTIKDLENEIAKQQRIIESAQKQIEKGVYTGSRDFRGRNMFRELSSEENKQLQRQIAEANQIMEGAAAQLKRLNGEELEEMIQSNIEKQKEREKALAEERAQKEAEEKARQQKQQQQEAAAAAYKALDENEIAERSALKKKYLDGEIATEEEYNERLLQLNIDAFKRRLQSGELQGKERLTAEEQLTTLLLQQKKAEQDKLDKIEEERIKSLTDATERENAVYAQRVRKAQGNDRLLEQLEAQHKRNLAKIQLAKINERIKNDEDAHQRERRNLRSQQASELLAFSGTAEEKKRLKKQHNEELIELDTRYASEMAEKLKELLDNGNFEGLSLDSVILSDEEKDKLIQKFTEVQDKLDSLDASKNNLDGEKLNAVSGTDLLGFSVDDWSTLFTNLKDGKVGVQEIAMAMKAMTAAYAMYDKFATAAENRQLKQFKKANDQKKKELDRRLDMGLISQDQYNTKVEQLDQAYEAKQEEIQIKQARRQKALSIASAIINTAVGATAAYDDAPFPFNIVLAAMISAMGAAQVALIASQPIAGAEEGGLLVTRAQDGKKFKAGVEPDKRGYVDRPTVITGEDGLEYVIPNEAMHNPTARPIIDIFETVRKQGRLADFNFDKVLPALYPLRGRAAGGPLGSTTETDAALGSMPFVENAEDAKKIIGLLEKLCDKADNPVPAVVSMLGRGGAAKAFEDYLKWKNNGKLGV